MTSTRWVKTDRFAHSVPRHRRTAKSQLAGDEQAESSEEDSQ